MKVAGSERIVFRLKYGKDGSAYVITSHPEHKIVNNINKKITSQKISVHPITNNKYYSINFEQKFEDGTFDKFYMKYVIEEESYIFPIYSTSFPDLFSNAYKIKSEKGHKVVNLEKIDCDWNRVFFHIVASKRAISQDFFREIGMKNHFVINNGVYIYFIFAYFHVWPSPVGMSLALITSLPTIGSVNHQKSESMPVRAFSANQLERHLIRSTTDLANHHLDNIAKTKNEDGKYLSAFEVEKERKRLQFYHVVPSLRGSHDLKFIPDGNGGVLSIVATPRPEAFGGGLSFTSDTPVSPIPLKLGEVRTSIPARKDQRG